MKKYNFIVALTYQTSIEIIANNEQEAKQKLNEVDIYAIELEQCCVVREDITLENEIKGKKYARQCSVTGQGMWEGWVFNEGDEYAKDEESANKLAKDYGYKDYEDAYNNGACYFTDWAEDDAQYIEINGNLIEIE